jgi:hypothetical protein
MSIRQQSAQWHERAAAARLATRRPCTHLSEGMSSYPAPSGRLRGGVGLDVIKAEKVNWTNDFDNVVLTS